MSFSGKWIEMEVIVLKQDKDIDKPTLFLMVGIWMELEEGPG